MFKISCSISVPYFLLLAEDQTLRALDLRIYCWEAEARGRPQVGLLAILQAEKLRIPAELPTLCWALYQALGQRGGGFKRQERLRVPARKTMKASCWSSSLGWQCRMRAKGKRDHLLSSVAQTSLIHKPPSGFLHTLVYYF